MSSISRLYTFQPGTVAKAEEVNAELDQLVTAVNAADTGNSTNASDIDAVEADIVEVNSTLATHEAAIDTKLPTATAAPFFKAVSFVANTGKFVFTHFDDTTTEIDTDLEKVPVSYAYNEDTKTLVITLDDASTVEIPVADLFNDYSFVDSPTIDFTKTHTEATGQDTFSVTAGVKEGSITASHLEAGLQSTLQGYANTASAQATVATTKASDAAASAAAAALSASTAGTHAATAGEQAGIATEEASSAAGSAAAAAGFASAAATSAAEAAASDAAAALSASTAGTHAAEAGGQAGIATEEASSAAGSAAAAAGFASAAATSAAEAAASDAAAALSASTAGTHAAEAGGQAGIATEEASSAAASAAASAGSASAAATSAAEAAASADRAAEIVGHDYVLKSEFNTHTGDTAMHTTAADKGKLSNLPDNTVAELDTKVDKAKGKSLTTNDYTNEDKERVDNIDLSFNVTVPLAGWSAAVDADGFYTNEVSVEGMKASYLLIMGIVRTTAEACESEEANYNKLKRVATYEGYVIFRCIELPEADVDVVLYK